MRGFLPLFIILMGMGGQISGLEAAEKSRTAVVNIQEVFREYYKSVVAQEQINVERARIQKESNEVQQRVKVMDAAIKTLKTRLADPVRSVNRSEKEQKTLRRELGIRIQERDSLEGARKSQIHDRHSELNRKMVVRMQAILQEIRHYVEETGRKAGYDYVFDMAGLNTSQVPPVLYAKDATDITAIILKELNKNAPQER